MEDDPLSAVILLLCLIVEANLEEDVALAACTFCSRLFALISRRTILFFLLTGVWGPKSYCFSNGSFCVDRNDDA